ncbi:MAG TPA: hypothetical protein VGL66_06955 [Caulobacteraceae bacterium]|jgi:hypothetical protein
MVKSESELRSVLFRAYGGFGDKRLKDLTRDAPFIVDDRSEADLDARGNLFHWFCQLWARVEAADRLQLTFRGRVPEGLAVTEWFAAHGAKQTSYGLVIELTPISVADLTGLCDAFSSILSRPYKVKAYKYVVPRAVGSLEQLRCVLSNAWDD